MTKGGCNKKCMKSVENHGNDCSEIRVEKNILNISYAGYGPSSNPDVIATYEIVIFNRSCSDLKKLKIEDSLLGFLTNADSTENEVNPYFTSIKVEACHCATIVPNTFEQIIECGSLVTCESYVKAKSVARIIVRIAGRGLFVANDNQVDPITQINVCVQNTVLVSGCVHKKKSCGCHGYVSIFPIYAKSGVHDTNRGLFFPQGIEA